MQLIPQMNSKYQLIESIRIKNKKNEIHVNGDDIIKSVKMTEKMTKNHQKPAKIQVNDVDQTASKLKISTDRVN